MVKIDKNIKKALNLLRDIYDALKNNSFEEEAETVKSHIAQLNSEKIRKQIKEKGIEPILYQLAQVFDKKEKD